MQFICIFSSYTQSISSTLNLFNVVNLVIHVFKSPVSLFFQCRQYGAVYCIRFLFHYQISFLFATPLTAASYPMHIFFSSSALFCVVSPTRRYFNDFNVSFVWHLIDIGTITVHRNVIASILHYRNLIVLITAQTHCVSSSLY